MNSAALLTATRVCKQFDGVHALREAQFELMPGEVHALLGENGAGKSTLSKILAGVVKADRGVFRLGGEPFRPINPRHAQAAGVAMIFQELDLFPELSIAENIVIGNHAFSEGLLAERSRVEEFCRPYLRRVGLNASANQLVRALAIGQQQLVAIARALSMNARILLMDEPTSALTEEAAEKLFEQTASLKESGVAVVYVSHKMDEIFRICDRVTVLRDGRHVDTLRIDETSMDELVQLMVGREVDRDEKSFSSVEDEILLRAERVSTHFLRSVSFSLHRGEVLGLAGLVGAGRTELGRALFGLDQIHDGRIEFSGKPFRPKSPRQAIRNSLGFVPEDRKRMGLMMQMSVRENMTLATLFLKQKSGLLNRDAERADYHRMKELTRLKANKPEQLVSTLSGGNQQKALLARWLMLDPDLIFLDDPTRGVDVGAKEDIYQLIERIAAERKGVIMVSSELPELLRCCDRVLVLNQGCVTADLDKNTTSQAEIMHYAATPLSHLEALQ